MKYFLTFIISSGLVITGFLGLNIQSVSANDHIEITSWAQLHTTRDNLAGSYILMNDLNADSAGYATYAGPGANAGAGWEPIGFDYDTPFEGSFNGNGHTISDLYIDRPIQENIGLFGYINASNIIGVHLKDIDVTGSGYIGGLVGFSDASNIDNSYSSGTVVGTESYIGGLVGFIDASNIDNSYSSADVIGSVYIGGLVGYSYASNIDNSYSVGGVTATGIAGGLLGENDAGTVTNSFWDTQTSGQATSDGGTGKTTEEMKNIATFTTDLGAEAWDFNTLWTMAGYPHLQDEWTTQISTCSELQMMKLNLTAEYVLVDDVDCSDTAIWNDQQGFEPIGYFDEEDESVIFTGSLDGDGYEISNLFMNWIGVLGMNQGGLFGAVYEAEIKDIYLTDVNISFNYEWGAVGSLVGIALNSVLNNIHSTGTTTGNIYTGGLVGILSELDISPATITNSSVAGSVTGTNYIGGLVGLNERGTIVDSSVSNTVNGIHRVGGLVGQSYQGIITDSFATGAVDGETYVGGLVGENSGTITSSYSNGDVTGNNDIGGLVGENSGTITDSSATGVVNGNIDVGGLVGENEGTVTSSSATGAVTGETYVGGLVGHNDSATISNSFATGNVTGDSDVGGLVGYSYDSTISNSYSTGNAMGTGNNVGGLVGFGDEGVIFNSYAIGSVTGDSDVGGLVGYTYLATITNAFWDTQTSGQTESAGGEGKTTAQMKSIATFTTELGEDAWDFDEIWGMSDAYNNGYACLLWDEDCVAFEEFDPLMVTTGSAIDIEKDSATLRATITAGAANAYGFFWGTTSHGDDALPQEMELDTGAIFEALLELYEDTDGIGEEGIQEAPFYYEIPIGDLVCNTTYYFRPMVFRDYSFGGSPEDVTIGNELSFTTLGCNDQIPTPRRSSGGQASPAFLASLGITLANPAVPTAPTTTPSLGEPGLCSADQILTQNLRAPSRNGVFNSYTGDIVREINILQGHLNRLGFNSGPVDGIAGPLTDGAIKRMQTFLKTTPDGYVGPITRGLLNQSCGSEGLKTS